MNLGFRWGRNELTLRKVHVLNELTRSKKEDVCGTTGIVNPTRTPLKQEYAASKVIETVNAQCIRVLYL